MKISSVHISNFRCYREPREFDFRSADFILISGDNGYGKTTLIDAIEWCFTGDCRRLHISYTARIKGENKGQNFSRGLLKSTSARENNEVKVTIKLTGCDITSITRKQKEDTLNPELSKLRINDTNGALYQGKEAQHKIEELLGMRTSDFYSYFICDINKTDQFRRSTREETTTALSPFLHDYTREENLIRSLNMMALKLKEQSGLQSKKIDQRQQKIDELKAAGAQRDREDSPEKSPSLHNISYPSARIYRGEDIGILGTRDLQKVRDQKMILTDYGRAKLTGACRLIRRNLVCRQNISACSSQLHYLRNANDLTRTILNEKLYRDEEKTAIEGELRDLNRILAKLKGGNNEAVLRAMEEVPKLGFPELNNSVCTEFIREYRAENEKIQEKKKNLELMRRGSDLVRALSELAALNLDLTEYRKLSDRCPLCGSSQTFPTLQQEQLAGEARNYLTEQDKVYSDQWKSVEEDRRSLEKRLKEMTGNMITVLQKKADRHNNMLQRINELENALGRILLAFDTESAAEEAEDGNRADRLCSFISRREKYYRQWVPTEEAVREAQRNILELESIPELKDTPELLKIRKTEKSSDPESSQDEPDLFPENTDPADRNVNKTGETEFSNQLLIEKLNILRTYAELLSTDENSRRLADLEKAQQEARRIQQEQEEIYSLISGKAGMIQKDVNTLKKEEVQLVGPYLNSIYTKLIKHTSVEDFKVHAANNRTTAQKIQMTTESDVPLFNILSEGQTGVYVISYFIGSALSRRSSSHFQTYFVDDITSCMDNINVLSFVDLFKYQLSQPENTRAMTQVIFATCDSNLVRMFDYKMRCMGLMPQENGKENENGSCCLKLCPYSLTTVE